MRAGILDERGDGPDLAGEILSDPSVSERQKQALIEIYRSFQAETAAERAREGAASERGVPG